MDTLKNGTSNAPAEQDKAIFNDTDIINEIDSLLQLYKDGIDGEVWSKLDSIFDDVQTIEYELAPEYVSPVDLDDEAGSVPTLDEVIEQPVEEDSEVAHDTKQIFTEAIAYIKQHRKLVAIAAGAACAMIVLLIALTSSIAPKPKDSGVQLNNTVQPESTENAATQIGDLEGDYNHAVDLMDSGKYDEAIVIFDALDGYQDSTEKISECHYKEASSLLEINNTLHALSRFSKAGNYKDAPKQAAALRKLYQNSLQLNSVSAGRNHTAAIKSDGTVVTAGSNQFDQCEVSDWTDIVSVSVGENHTAGLKADGKVLNAGAINVGQSNVLQWRDIIAISARRNHTIVLKADGTVVSAGRNDYGQCDVRYWENITAISTGEYHTVGLKADGTVVAAGLNNNGQCDVSDWTDIIGVYAGDNHTVGLKADGSVIAAGYNAYGQCDLSDWTDIVDIGIGSSYTIGLKADGTLIIAGYHYGELDIVSTWTDIIAISAGASHTMGLKADGTVVSVNFDYDDQMSISEWGDIRLPG